jgi:hypothetical protein
MLYGTCSRFHATEVALYGPLHANEVVIFYFMLMK